MKPKLPLLAARFPWRRVAIFAGGICSLALLLAAGIWIREKSQARALYGTFDMDYRCMGGHEIFLTLEETAAYEDCPGHREKKWIGRIDRNESEVMVRHPKDNTPWIRISWDGNRHFLSFVHSPGRRGTAGDVANRQYLPQVVNPFRTRLPRYLPE